MSLQEYLDSLSDNDLAEAGAWAAAGYALLDDTIISTYEIVRAEQQRRERLQPALEGMSDE